ncbi:Lipid droplet-associated hydrolase [Paramyrothecium foliicola]|nr:Lipid droplet-associated hydrolase [Paramyrothecium foliicola]
MLTSIDLPSQRTSAKRRGLIYFVPGNPGLIEYYADYLRCLRGILDGNEAKHGTAYDLHGRNLLGFKDADHAPFSASNEPWDLEGQVEGVYEQVAKLRTAAHEPYDVVILTGHSVGGYISVDVFHRHMQNPSRAPHLNLQHGFLLFPTLTDIALSPSGTRATALLGVPLLEPNAHRLAKLVLTLFPQSTLRLIVQRWMGFSPQTAAVTAEWLKSRDGVWQAIHLGRSELRTITEEKWEQELWETSQPSASATRFFLFYGREDHWVANHIRDEFIAKRKQGETRIAVDEGDLPHAFCVREGESECEPANVTDWSRHELGGCAQGGGVDRRD